MYKSDRTSIASGIDENVGPWRKRALIVLFIMIKVVVIVVGRFVGKIGRELGNLVELIVGNGGMVVLIGPGVTLAGLVVVVVVLKGTVCVVEIVVVSVYCQKI